MSLYAATKAPLPPGPPSGPPPPPPPPPPATSAGASPWPQAASASPWPAASPTMPQSVRMNVHGNSGVKVAKRTEFHAVSSSASQHRPPVSRSRASIGSGMNYSMGIVQKTELHNLQKKVREQEALEAQASFKPKITPYSAQLVRSQPIAERLFNEGKKLLKRRAALQRDYATYERETGRKLFHPKVTRPSPAAAKAIQEPRGSPVGKKVTIEAGQRLYREAELSRERKRRQMLLVAVEEGQKRAMSKMTPKSRDLARRRLERNLQAVFMKLNTSGTGNLTAQEVSEGMRSANIQLPVLSPADIEMETEESMVSLDVRLWHLLDTKEKGSVDLLEFLDVISPVVDAAKPNWSIQDMKAPLTSTQLVLVYASKWLGSLTRDGGVHGHVPSANSRTRWREAAVLSASPCKQESALVPKKDPKFHHPSDEKECTFAPQINDMSRHLDKRQTEGVLAIDDDIHTSAKAKKSGMERHDLMLHRENVRRKRMEFKRAARQQEELEECTFHPCVTHSSRTLNQSRKAALSAREQPQSREELEDVFRESRGNGSKKKGEVFESLYADAVQKSIKFRHPKLTTEEKEYQEHCTFRPMVATMEQEQMRLEDVAGRAEDSSEDQSNFHHEETLDNVFENLGGRMPWESVGAESSQGNVEQVKMSIRSSIVNLKTTSSQKDEVSLGKPKKVDTSKLWGYNEHAERIRKARSDRVQRELEFEMMGKVAPGQFEKGLRTFHKIKENLKAEQNINVRSPRTIKEELRESENGTHFVSALSGQKKEDDAVYNAEPDLVMNVNVGSGKSGVINIYRGDDPGVLASNFAALHSLNPKKQGKLREHILNNMREHDIYYGRINSPTHAMD